MNGELIFGLAPGAFWLLIGGPFIVIVAMFLYMLRIRAEKDDE